MPSFDLRNIKCAEYSESNDNVSYSNATVVGDAMSVDINLRFAEGRLYAESSLAEYLRKCTGGTVSMGVKYIKDAKGLVYGSKNVHKAVGIAAFAPDMIDGVEKYTAFLIYRTVMSEPSINLRTMGENIQFATPTSSGEFMPRIAASKDFLEVAVLDTEAEAIAWVDLVLNASAGGGT